MTNEFSYGVEERYEISLSSLVVFSGKRPNEGQMEEGRGSEAEKRCFSSFALGLGESQSALARSLVGSDEEMVRMTWWAGISKRGDLLLLEPVRGQ